MINKGDVITNRKSNMPITKHFEADIKLFELLDHKKVFTRGYTCMIHCHTVLEECEITDVLSLVKKTSKNGAKETVNFPSHVKS